MTVHRIVLVTIIVGWISAVGLAGDETTTEQEIAATVNEIPIYAGQIKQSVQLALARRDVTPERLVALRREALNQLIKRQLVLTWLRRNGDAASQADVDLAIGRLKDRLGRQEKSLGDYLQTTGLNERSLSETLAWQISWKRYLEKYVTDENLSRYFNQHRSEFDGTKLRAAQILLKVPDGNDATSPIILHAKKIRQEVLDGKKSFADAAEEYSQAPSSQAGGALGLIARDGPMPESFSRVAFELEVGEISKPVSSRFGVHLIQCLEIVPGTRTWQQARDPLQEAIPRYLFDWISDRERPRAQIRMTVPK